MKNKYNIESNKKHNNKGILKGLSRDDKNLFIECLCEVKISDEAERLKAEGKTLKDFTNKEIEERYIDWTFGELELLSKMLECTKNV